MPKVEVFVKEHPNGGVVSLVKIGFFACRGIDFLEKGERRLIHTRTRGSNALQKAVNDAYIQATTRELAEAVDNLVGLVRVVNG